MASRKQTTVNPSTRGAWKLAANETRRLPRGRPVTTVRVERGTVLVTQQGDLEDHVLEPGDELVLVGGGLAVAWAFREAAISVHELVRIGSWRSTRLGGRSLADAARGVL